jgi:predicted acyl esterase
MSNLSAAGHRTRVHTSSSTYPRFDVNPNSGGPSGEPAPMVGAHNAIYHDVDHVSHSVLRVISG